MKFRSEGAIDAGAVRLKTSPMLGTKVSLNSKTLCVALMTGLALGATAPAKAQAPVGLSPFVGVWRVNLEKSRMGRAGPGGETQARAETFTWVYRSKGANLAWDIYHEYPQEKPSKSMTVIPDGRYRPCEMDESCLSRPGDPKEQSYAFWQMTPYTFARVFQVKGKPVEYNVYAAAPDGKSFTTTVWSPETPQWQTVMVFEKQP